MADLGHDAKIAALKAAKTAGEWYKALDDLLPDLYNSKQNSFGPAAKQEATGVAPTGMITAWAGPADSRGNLTAPSAEWLPCSGQSLSRTTYVNLFRVIGTAYGSASATTFSLPDLGRRVIIGKGGTKPAGSNGPATTLGATGGAESHVITAAQLAEHHHDAGSGLTVATDGAHSHGIRNTRSRTGADGLSVPTTNQQGTTSTAGLHRHSLEGNSDWTGAAAPEAITLYSKSLVMGFVIKT